MADFLFSPGGERAALAGQRLAVGIPCFEQAPGDAGPGLVDSGHQTLPGIKHGGSGGHLNLDFGADGEPAIGMTLDGVQSTSRVGLAANLIHHRRKAGGVWL